MIFWCYAIIHLNDKRECMKKYFVAKCRGAESQGPYEIEQIQVRVDLEEITPQCICRAADDANWKPICSFPELRELFSEEELQVLNEELPPIPQKPIPVAAPVMPVARAFAAPVAQPVKQEGASPLHKTKVTTVGNVVLLMLLLFFLQHSISSTRNGDVQAVMYSLYMISGGAILLRMLLPAMGWRHDKDKGRSLYLLALFMFVMTQMVTWGDRITVRNLCASVVEGINIYVYASVVIILMVVSAMAGGKSEGQARGILSTPGCFLLLVALLRVLYWADFLDLKGELVFYLDLIAFLLALLLVAFKLGNSGYEPTAPVWPLCCLVFFVAWVEWISPGDLSSKPDEVRAYTIGALLLPITIPAMIMGARLVSHCKAHPLKHDNILMTMVPILAVCVFFYLPELTDLAFARPASETGYAVMHAARVCRYLFGNIFQAVLVWGAAWAALSMMWGALRNSSISNGVASAIAVVFGIAVQYVVSGIAVIYDRYDFVQAPISKFKDIFDDDFFEPWFYSNVNLFIVFVIMFMMAYHREKRSAL